MRQLNWPTLEDIINERDIAMMFRAIHYPQALDTLRDRIVYRRDLLSVTRAVLSPVYCSRLGCAESWREGSLDTGRLLRGTGPPLTLGMR